MTDSSLFRVTQGAIHVNSISVYHRSDEAVVFTAHMAKRGSEVVGCSCNEVIVMPEGPVTSAPTTIGVSLPDDGTGWTVFAEVSGCTLMACAAKLSDPDRHYSLGWDDMEER